jgi:hypothetical protein
LRKGTLDAWVEFLPAAGEGAALERNFEVRLRFDASKARGDLARERVEGVLREYRERWLQREAEKIGIEPGAWQVYADEREERGVGTAGRSVHPGVDAAVCFS